MDKKDIEVASFLLENTSEDSVCLTSQESNNPVFMRTHCQVLAAYEGWIYSYGIDYLERIAEIRKMYENPGENLSLFEKYEVDYVIIGDAVHENFDVDEAYFLRNTSQFTEVFKNDAYSVFSVSI
jgi:uncharacterized membrane protein